MRFPFTRSPRSLRAVALTLSLLVALTSLAACDVPSGQTISQNGGLPALRSLNWGFPDNEEALWSPDGRWIALNSGNNADDTHLRVVSPDGRERHDLALWGCKSYPSYDYAWLQDGRLACIQTFDPPYQMCIGAGPFTTCDVVPLPATFQTTSAGAVWTPDGMDLLLAAYTVLPDGTAAEFPDLYVLNAAGHLLQALPFVDRGGIYFPTWVPHAQAISYLNGKDPTTDLSPLVESAVTRDAAGRLTLGPPRTLATGQTDFTGQHAWSPSGHWVAVRLNDAGGDRIALVNAANPAQTLNVTSPDFPDGLTDPIWSPDGQTLIVFRVTYGAAQPYAIAIADYLKSKGLQP
jgi:dipeptidyl aminopeptidase/acylaminoacyl peptidase